MRIPEYDEPGRAEGYGKRAGTTRVESRILSRLLADLPPGGRILDVPCGNGRLAPLLRTREPRLLLGADGSMEMARCAAFRYDGVLAVDATSLPLASDAADLVLCVRLLHHFPSSPDRVAILRELARVSRDRVVVTFYRRGTLEGLRRRLRPKRPSGRIGLPLRTVRGELERAGLVVERVRSLLPLIREQTVVLARCAR